MSSTKYKSPLKWVGGKTQIIDKFLWNFPKEMNNYYEIFLGGGSVLISFLEQVQTGFLKVKGQIYSFDFNKNLIGFFNNIKDNHTLLLGELEKLKDEFFECPDKGEVVRDYLGGKIGKKKTSKESYYYYCRHLYNSLSEKEKIEPRGSALFLFLNKTCFRGLHRESKNGFNVPYGNYKNPSIYEEKNIKVLSKLFRENNVVFKHMSFEKSLKLPKKGDFVYMDPPYYPETEKSFVGYNSGGFDKEKHELFFSLCEELDNKKVLFLMNNSDTPIVKKFFSPYKYYVGEIEVRRRINSKNPESKTGELIITNNSE